MKFDCAPIRADFTARITIVRQLLDATRLGPTGSPPAPGLPDVSREARGVAIVLLYAAYEALLKATARRLLEAAVRTRVGNRRLQPGYQVAAVFSKLQAISAIKDSKIWKGPGTDIVNAIFAGQPSSIDPTLFPDTGDNFKRAQVFALCELLGLGDPGPVLKDVWLGLDSVVVQRNNVAHGLETATEVGRQYSDADLTNLVDAWALRWGQFLDWVEAAGTSRDLYRRP